MSMAEQVQETNYLTPSEFYTKFLHFLPRIEPFHSENKRKNMSAQDWIYLAKIMYGCGLRVSEALKLVKSDFDLEKKLIYIRDAKTGKKIIPKTHVAKAKTLPAEYKKEPQKTTLLPYDIPWIKKFLETKKDGERLFPVTRQLVWNYFKQAGNMANLSISEEQDNRSIEGVWTHLFRKSCAKRMRELGAEIELVAVKLRHKLGKGRGSLVTFTYTKKDINALLFFEAKHFAKNPYEHKEGNVK